MLRERFLIKEMKYVNQLFLGLFEAAQVLLEHSANPNIADTKGFVPLHYAAQANSPNCIKQLIKHEVLILK